MGENESSRTAISLKARKVGAAGPSTNNNRRPRRSQALRWDLFCHFRDEETKAQPEMMAQGAEVSGLCAPWFCLRCPGSLEVPFSQHALPGLRPWAALGAGHWGAGAGGGVGDDDKEERETCAPRP